MAHGVAEQPVFVVTGQFDLRQRVKPRLQAPGERHGLAAVLGGAGNRRCRRRRTISLAAGGQADDVVTGAAARQHCDTCT